MHIICQNTGMVFAIANSVPYDGTILAKANCVPINWHKFCLQQKVFQNIGIYIAIANYMPL